MRELDYCLQANSFDPRDGPVSWPAPDLASLQISGEGADLAFECDIQTAAEQGVCTTRDAVAHVRPLMIRSDAIGCTPTCP